MAKRAAVPGCSTSQVCGEACSGPWLLHPAGAWRGVQRSLAAPRRRCVAKRAALG
ncbi:hypothetical protein GNP94_10005 [Paenibacillus campinasensis]|uniref:Uncharacterized protein n=1 Tax=Paenibacillus campinasensis TaxID=66347 RepID=A0ABW9SZY9_9BACL|nr:hypothetical protein [Paenibacillus campinasensis]MUG66347.1 hypothetical protein [Paenibacillus campinasensis]